MSIPGLKELCASAAGYASSAAWRRRAGVTLVELMVATVIISVGVLGMVGSFNYINRGIQGPKGKSLANNLAQEKIEVLKNKSYFRVLVSTGFDNDGNFTPAYKYDTYPNGSETLNVGGINYTRRVLITKVGEDSDGKLKDFNWNDPDTGLKEVLVYVTWQEGSSWKKVELRNLIGNPNRTNLSATFSGTVLEGGTPIEGAIVRAQQNPARYDTTDAAGGYNIPIEPGQYTLQATKPGYFQSVSPLYTIETTKDHDFTLTKMVSGTISGSAWLRDHLLISQIVGSTNNASGQSQEWIEVYNPTTWTWTMASGLGTDPANKRVIVVHTEAGESDILPNFDYRRTFVSPGAYFLFANTGTITAAGVTRTADAVYSVDADFSNIDDMIETGSPSPAGFVNVIDVSTMRELDWVGWDATDNGASEQKNAPRYEGMAIQQSIGLQPEEEYVRKTNSSTSALWYGRCYDTNNNENNFEDHVPLSHPPHYSYDSEPCVSGTPAAGAVVFANDSLSSSTQAATSGSFSLSGVATGYWTLYISSGVSLSSGGVYGGTTSGFSVAAGSVLLSSSSSYGFVSGLITGADGGGLPDIKVAAGGRQTTTLSDGRYTLPADPGEQTILANYQTDNLNYIETSSAGVVAVLGEMTPNVDFVLLTGGKLRGWVTTNGTDPLPNVPVSAFKGGVEQGTGISGSDGYFLVWGSGISTGTYEVVVQLEAGETPTPSTHTATLSAGETLFVGTFTVSGAMGSLTGSVRAGTADITTGVLVYATSSTITGSPLLPPTINAATRAGSVIYYAVSSNAQGTYTLPVRGGYTYNVYAWYTNWNETVPNTTPQQTTAAVAAGQTVTRNFSW